MGATPWTELSGTAPSWTQGFPAASSGTLDAVIIGFGVALPVTGYTIWADPTTAYTELTGSLTAYTELVGSLTPYTELTL